MNELINPLNLTFNPQQMTLLMPYLILVIGAMISLVAGVLNTSSDAEINRKNRNFASMSTALITIVAALFSIIRMWGEGSSTLFNNMLAADYYSNLFNIVFLGATGLVLLSSYAYLEKEEIHHAEYYSLALFSCLGMMLLASSLDMITLFVSLEIMSIAIYVLVGFRRTDVRSNEAAVKYFILGAAVSAIMLYGIAMIYGASGTMNIPKLGEWLVTADLTNPLFIIGAVLVIAGFLFKVASVPFHMWMPDVYEGAPITVTNLMTTGLKAAAFAAFLRVFIGLGYSDSVKSLFDEGMHNILWVVAVATMFIGNAIALTQRNLKRMLAYSSIAHTGYILVGLLSGGRSEYGYSSVVMYLITYVLMNVGAFAIISMITEKGDEHCNIENLAGLGIRNPVVGLAMSVFMFSMAGVPPMAGFAGKYLIFSSAVQAGEIWLAVLGVVCSAISAYYYLRVIVFMYMKDASTNTSTVHRTIPTTVVIMIAMIATIQFGLFPNILIHAAKKAAMYI